MVYGTPWAGKEALERNTSAPINAICILKQSKTNNIARLSQSEALSHLMRQVYMPHNASALGITLGLLGKLLEKIPIYLLQCDISDEAFYTSFNEITKTQEV